MSKQFKLVYENAGELKGSYTGIPANDDVDVIKRTVLEGKESAPVGPTIDTNYITYFNGFDLHNFIQLFTASGQIGDPDLAKAVQALFAESYWYAELPIEEGSTEYFDCIILFIEPTSPNSADLEYCLVSDTTKRYACSCLIENDAETGDTRMTYLNIEPLEPETIEE